MQRWEKYSPCAFPIPSEFFPVLIHNIYDINTKQVTKGRTYQGTLLVHLSQGQKRIPYISVFVQAVLGKVG